MGGGGPLVGVLVGVPVAVAVGVGDGVKVGVAVACGSAGHSTRKVYEPAAPLYPSTERN